MKKQYSVLTFLSEYKIGLLERTYKKRLGIKHMAIIFFSSEYKIGLTFFQTHSSNVT